MIPDDTRGCAPNMGLLGCAIMLGAVVWILVMCGLFMAAAV